MRITALCRRLSEKEEGKGSPYDARWNDMTTNTNMENPATGTPASEGCVLVVHPDDAAARAKTTLTVWRLAENAMRRKTFAKLVQKDGTFVDEATGSTCVLPWTAGHNSRYLITEDAEAGMPPVTVSITRNGRWAVRCGQMRIAAGLGVPVEFSLAGNKPQPAIKLEVRHKKEEDGIVDCTVAITNIGNIPLANFQIRHTIAPLCSSRPDELAVTQTMTLTWPDVPGDLAPNATAYARCRYALRSLDAIAHGFTSRVSVSAASPQGASAKAEANEVYMLPLDCKNMDNDGCIRLAETTLRMLSEEYIAACQSRSIAQKQTVGRYIRRHPFLCLVSSDVDGILRSLEHKAFAPS